MKNKSVCGALPWNRHEGLKPLQLRFLRVHMVGDLQLTSTGGKSIEKTPCKFNIGGAYGS